MKRIKCKTVFPRSVKRQEIDKMEFWDIYDADKKPTGRTMKRNDWCLKDGEYHLTVFGAW